MITYEIDNLNGDSHLPLFHRFSGQSNAQPAYVQLDEDGEVSADYSSFVGNAVTPEVYCLRTLQWDVDAKIRGSVLSEFLLSDVLAGLFQQVYEGHSVELVNGRLQGTLDEEASEAYEEIEDLLRNLADEGNSSNQKDVWLVDDFLFASNRLWDVWQEGSLADAVVASKQDAAAQDVHLDGDVADCLLDEAQRLFELDDYGLSADHLDALLRAGRVTQKQVDEYIDSSD